MTKSQIQLKNEVIATFLDNFDTLNSIISNLNMSKEDEVVVRSSIEQDFITACH